MIGTAGASLGKWARRVEANDAESAFTVNQRGSGAIVDFKSSGNTIFTILDGNATYKTTIQHIMDAAGTESGWDIQLQASKSTGTYKAFTINVAHTLSGAALTNAHRLFDLQVNGGSKFLVWGLGAPTVDVYPATTFQSDWQGAPALCSFTGYASSNDTDMGQLVSGRAVHGVYFGQVRINSASGAKNCNNSATIYVAGPPVQGTNVTLNTPWAIRAESGETYLGGAARINLPSDGVALDLKETAVSATSFKIAKVSMAYTGALFNAAATTDNTVIWAQPANSILVAIRMVLDTRFVATGMTDLDVTVGNGGDVDGICAPAAMNLTSDALATEYSGPGALLNTNTCVSIAGQDWTAYATAVGANLSTLSAGVLIFYITYIQL